MSSKRSPIASTHASVEEKEKYVRKFYRHRNGLGKKEREEIEEYIRTHPVLAREIGAVQPDYKHFVF